MKDYSTGSESKRFILSYKVEDNKIIAKLACGELYTIPYSQENENKIISLMEKQADSAYVTPLRTLTKTLMVTSPLLLPLDISNFVNYGGWYWGTMLFTGVVSVILFDGIIGINQLIMKRDEKKLKEFLNCKESLNKSLDIALNNRNITLGVSKKAIKEIELQKGENKEIVNINNIDNFSLNDLKTLQENLKRISYFGFDEDQTKFDQTEEKGKSPRQRK